MVRSLPSLDLLRGFEAAARQLSFTRAAAELFLTQSAVSRQIKSLEDELGAALLQRLFGMIGRDDPHIVGRPEQEAAEDQERDEEFHSPIP